MDIILWTIATLVCIVVLVVVSLALITMFSVFFEPSDELEYFSDDDW